MDLAPGTTMRPVRLAAVLLFAGIAVTAAFSLRGPPDRIWVLDPGMSPPPWDTLCASPEGERLSADWRTFRDCGLSRVPEEVCPPAGCAAALLRTLGMHNRDHAPRFVPNGKVVSGPAGLWWEYVRVVESWQHFTDGRPIGRMDLLADGSIAGHDGATWARYGDRLHMTWPAPQIPGGRWIDACTVAADGRSYDGSNQRGNALRGEWTDNSAWWIR
jgi:hypothetical protein